jgi:hypothetical protein
MMPDPNAPADLSARWQAAAHRYRLLTPDPSETFWEGMFSRLDAMQADLCVLDAAQLDQMDALRERMNDLDHRERAYLNGLMMQLMCVATDELEAYAQ